MMWYVIKHKPTGNIIWVERLLQVGIGIEIGFHIKEVISEYRLING